MGSSSSRNLDGSRQRSSRRHASDDHQQHHSSQSHGRLSRTRQADLSSSEAVFRIDERQSPPGREHIQIEISRGGGGGSGGGSSSSGASGSGGRCSCARESVIVEVDNSQSSRSHDEEAAKEEGVDSDEETDRSGGGEDVATASSSSSPSSSSSSSPSSSYVSLGVENLSSSSASTSSNPSQQQQQHRDSSSGQFLDQVPVDLVRSVEHSGRESRRNSGRRFWDALTRAASHRRSTAAPITIVAIEEIDENGSSTSRWNFQHWRTAPDAENSEGSGSRTMDWEERRRHVRSHVWALQRLSGGLQISHGHARSCPAAGQFNGNCSCETQATEDSSTRASISRIIMLAEALFEVLDEIHRQSVALSQSASMPLALLPAPDTVVNLIPLRSYEKSAVAASEEAAQCHICLVEYEEGDQIRVLPCQHEYHQACVDKWLKEVHRVCPLCRGNVCSSKAVAAAGTAEAL